MSKKEEPDFAALRGPEPTPPEHAAGEAPPVPERVDHIMALMAGGWWSSRKILQLAAAWSLSPSTIRDSSAEASRRLKLARGDLDEQRQANIGRLEATYDLAMNLGDTRGAVAAATALANVTGMMAPTKVALTNGQGEDVPAAMVALLARAPASFLAPPGPAAAPLPATLAAPESILQDKLPDSPETKG